MNARWAEWIDAAGDSMGSDGVPAIALSSPGALFLFNNSSYANPWVDAMWPVSFRSITAACGGEPPHDLDEQPSLDFLDALVQSALVVLVPDLPYQLEMKKLLLRCTWHMHGSHLARRLFALDV